jgi:hypothetical protein
MDIDWARVARPLQRLTGTPGTSVALVKALVDDMNVGGRPVAAMHVYPNLDIVQKAVTQR